MVFYNGISLYEGLMPKPMKKRYGWMLPFPKETCTPDEIVTCLNKIRAIGRDFEYVQNDELVYDIPCTMVILLFETLVLAQDMAEDLEARLLFEECVKDERFRSKRPFLPSDNQGS